MKHLAQNKYSWILTNLMLSVGSLWFFFILPAYEKEDITGFVGLVMFILLVMNAYWIYKTLKYWRRCLQEDDAKFDAIVSDMNKKQSE